MLSENIDACSITTLPINRLSVDHVRHLILMVNILWIQNVSIYNRESKIQGQTRVSLLYM